MFFSLVCNFRRFCTVKTVAHRSFVTQITQRAPNFSAMAYMPSGEFKEISLSDYAGKYVVLYWYPLDFTFVCASELVKFSEMKPEFDKRNVQLLGISVDSQFAHKAWVKTPKFEGGLENTVFHPLVSDLKREISSMYGVLLPEGHVACRGVVLIDKGGVIQSEMRNNLPLGRNVDEVLRIVDALQHHEKHGKVMPANWVPGKPDMAPTQEGVAEYLIRNT